MVGKKLSRAGVAGSAGGGMEGNNLSSKLKHKIVSWKLKMKEKKF